MIGICPNCNIKLKEPPFSNRETNEVMITLAYRSLVETGVKPKGINELGHCEVCKATLKDLKDQIKKSMIPKV